MNPQLLDRRALQAAQKDEDDQTTLRQAVDNWLTPSHDPRRRVGRVLARVIVKLVFQILDLTVLIPFHVVSGLFTFVRYSVEYYKRAPVEMPVIYVIAAVVFTFVSFMMQSITHDFYSQAAFWLKYHPEAWTYIPTITNPLYEVISLISQLAKLLESYPWVMLPVVYLLFGKLLDLLQIVWAMLKAIPRHLIEETKTRNNRIRSFFRKAHRPVIAR